MEEGRTQKDLSRGLSSLPLPFPREQVGQQGKGSEKWSSGGCRSLMAHNESEALEL